MRLQKVYRRCKACNKVLEQMEGCVRLPDEVGTPCPFCGGEMVRVPESEVGVFEKMVSKVALVVEKVKGEV